MSITTMSGPSTCLSAAAPHLPVDDTQLSSTAVGEDTSVAALAQALRDA